MIAPWDWHDWTALFVSGIASIGAIVSAVVAQRAIKQSDRQAQMQATFTMLERLQELTTSPSEVTMSDADRELVKAVETGSPWSAAAAMSARHLAALDLLALAALKGALDRTVVDPYMDEYQRYGTKLMATVIDLRRAAGNARLYEHLEQYLEELSTRTTSVRKHSRVRA
jgi:hypothetical protein